jgi:hypothetical protein
MRKIKRAVVVTIVALIGLLAVPIGYIFITGPSLRAVNRSLARKGIPTLPDKATILNYNENGLFAAWLYLKVGNSGDTGIRGIRGIRGTQTSIDSGR